MTFTLLQLWQLFLAMCGSFATIAGAVAIIYKTYKWAKKPDSERDKLLKKHSELLDNDNKRFKEYEERLKENEEQNRIMMKSILVIMKHLVDGNHTEELKKMASEAQDYLISR